MGVHSSHPAIAARLKRARGHLDRVIAMVEEDRPCLEVAQQLQAVSRAIANAKSAFIRDHIDNCLDNAAGDPHAAKKMIAEFKEITKYL